MREYCTFLRGQLTPPDNMTENIGGLTPSNCTIRRKWQQAKTKTLTRSHAPTDAFTPHGNGTHVISLFKHKPAGCEHAPTIPSLQKRRNRLLTSKKIISNGQTRHYAALWFTQPNGSLRINCRALKLTLNSWRFSFHFLCSGQTARAAGKVALSLHTATLSERECLDEAFLSLSALRKQKWDIPAYLRWTR